MAKTVELTYKGKHYTLEYTRNSVAVMERRGFKLEDLDSKPITSLPTLFAGAFIAHHSNVKPTVIEEIFGKIKNKKELLANLVDMYNEPIIAMMEEPEDDGDEGNVDWRAS